MIPALLAKIGLPILSGVIGEALGAIENPVAKTAAKALRDVDLALGQGAISPDQIGEANRHAEKIMEIQMQTHAAVLTEINESLRAEIASQDLYVRCMRPTFGYLMAITWAAQMLGLAYVIAFETENAGTVLNGMGSLSAIWAVGLSVLGIYVYKRSEDKKLNR